MIRLIMLNELKGSLRERKVQLLAGFTALLLILPAWSSQHTHQHLMSARQQAEAISGEQWDSLGAYNPHSAAHYGTYAYRPPGLLRMLDAGVQPFTGDVLKVEGHVQNEALYAEASRSSSLMRFSQFQPALVLQAIVPLLILFLAFGSIARERETGTLKMLILQGASFRQLMFGKALAYWMISLALLLATVLMMAVLYRGQVPWSTFMVFLASYMLYYLLVALLSVYVSARAGRSSSALAILLGGWLLWVFILPKLAAQLGQHLYPLPSRIVFEEQMREDRKKGLDGHNPSDERLKALEEEVMAEYEVDSLAQLPINFDGLAMQEDEEYGNQVWDKHFGDYYQTVQQQNRVIQWAAALAPFLAIRNLSMALSGTSLYDHLHFQQSVENYRRGWVKALNDEHTYGGSKTGDWSWKAEAEFFQSMEAYRHPTPGLQWSLSNRWPELAILIAWLLLAVGIITFSKKLPVLNKH
jgi:ABC-2 type transport system permease protein